MILSITNHIYQVLSADSVLASMVGTKIFPLLAKNEVEAPFIIIQRDTVNPDYDKSEMTNADTDATVFVAANSYTESLAIAERVVAVLDKKTAHYAGFDVDDATLTGASEHATDNGFIQQLMFNFQIIENEYVYDSN